MARKVGVKVGAEFRERIARLARERGKGATARDLGIRYETLVRILDDARVTYATHELVVQRLAKINTVPVAGAAT